MYAKRSNLHKTSILSALNESTESLVAPMKTATLNTKRRYWGSTPNLTETSSDGEHVVLSYNQEQTLQVGNLPPDHPLHLVSHALMIYGPFEVTTLERCLQQVVDAHDSLRTSFVGLLGSTPVQLVHPQMDVGIGVFNLTRNTPDEESLRKTMAEDAQRPFDISHGPLLRATVYKLSNTSSALMMTTHRGICDDASIKLLVHTMFILYEAAIYNRTVSMPLPGMQYSEFATWQRKQLPKEKLNEKYLEWKKSMDGIPFVVQLPTDYQLPPIPNYKGVRLALSLSSVNFDQFEKLATQHGVSIEVPLLASLQILLHRYTGQAEFAVGKTVTSNLLPGLKRLIGCFSNVVVVKALMSGNPTFIELLDRVKSAIVEAEENADFPVEMLMKRSSSTSSDQFVNAVFSYEDDDGILAPLNGIRFGAIPLNVTACKYEVRLHFMKGDAGISGYIDYNPDLFLPETMKRMAGHVETLLKNVCDNPNQRVMNYKFLSKAERQELFDWNSNSYEMIVNECIHQSIEKEVVKSPGAVAVVFEGAKITYEELNKRANKVAHYLIGMGVLPESLVAISLERGIDMVVGLLAIMKSGGAFSFVDPNFPKDRISYLLTNAKAKIMLCQTSLLSVMPTMKDVTIICLDKADAYSSMKDTNPVTSVTTENLAYIQFTSGSTGNPKGVVVSHSNLTNMIMTGKEFYMSEHLSNQLAATTLSFIPGIQEILFPLVCGKTITVVKNAFVLPNTPNAHEVNYVGAVPSVMIELLRMNAIVPSVHTVAMFGEPITKHLIQRIYEQTQVQQIFLIFGCTEVGSVVMLRGEKDYRKNPPIGRPLKNTQFLVLDSEQQLVPVGIPGELYIVSAGMARGYLDREDLTAERFVPNPYAEQFDPEFPWPTELRESGWIKRMYRTGDLVRHRPDGTLDILGRIDHQVKIRGIRVELGEIENAIRKHEGVHEVVVTAFQPSIGDKKLVAYVVTKDSHRHLAHNDLRDFLKENVPQHMIPSVFMFLDKLPQTANGKVDRKLLPQPEVNYTPDNNRNSVAARNEVEKKMCSLWADILQLKSVSVEDNFYEIGGNSMRAIQLTLKISECFNVNLPAKCLFENPTVEGLCSVVQDALDGNLMTAEAFDPEEEAVLDEDIFPARAYVDVETLWTPRDIFLTGATGFLGAFIVAELFQKTIAHIHCLVRATDSKSGFKRLEENLSTYNLWNPNMCHRLTAVIGDLEKPMLGMTKTNFFQLGQRIDVIYHCGSPVNFVKPYSSLKAGAVLGTQEILRLACLFKVKPVHYVSSVVVLASSDKKLVREMDDLNSTNSFFHMGYTRSKWVAEMLVWIAKSRGLPVTILRPGYVTGHSRTGTTNTNDYFARLVKGCIEVGTYPDMYDMMWLIPVDYVSRAIVHLTRLPQSLGKAFHLAPLPGTDVNTVQMLDMVRSYGYHIEKRSPSEWVKELEIDVKQHDNALLPLLPYISHMFRDDIKAQAKRTADYDCTNTLTSLSGSMITCPRVDQTVVNALLQYYINIGWIPPPPK